MKRNDRRSGQSLVEFALVMPLFLAIIFGILDVGRGVWAMDIVAHAANEAARFAIVRGGTASNTCPVGPPSGDANLDVDPAKCPHPSPSKQAIYNVAMQAAIASGSGTTVTVCYGEGCTGDADAPGATNARGTPVTVRVTAHVQIFTGALVGINDFTVTGTTTMLVNH